MNSPSGKVFMDERIRLEPTAAFVMHLGLQLFEADPLLQAYIDRLDLSSAQGLIGDCKALDVYDLSKELMCNRKFTVRHCLFDLLEKSAKPMQVVILAAGKSPLGLEAAVKKSSKIKRIFEIDISSMADKAQLYTALVPESRPKVFFIEQEISSEALIPLLSKQTYDPAAETVIVLEGITHYLSHAKCKQVLSRFVSPHRANHIIFEYGPPFETMADWVRPKAMAAYKGTEHRYHPGMTKYTPQWIGDTLAALGGKLEKIFHMDEMERMRTGMNQFFKEPNSGWVEVATGTL